MRRDRRRRVVIAALGTCPRGVWRVAAMLLAALALLLGVHAVADAHAVLVSAEPAAGSRLAASPPRVRLVFSEPLEAALARLSLVAADGGVTRLVAAGDPRDVHAVVAPVDALAPGAYRVAWRVVSADGHPVEGSYVFSVGAAVDPAAAPPDVHAGEEAPAAWGPTVEGAPLVPALLRGLALTSLMALAGVLGFIAWPRPGGEPAPPRGARLAGVLSLAAPVLLAAHAAAWLVTASPDHRLTGDAVAAGAAGGAGRAELWRAGLALLALWALGLARRPRLALAFAVGALLVSGAVGHSAAISPAWATPAKALHLGAGAAWLGGLLWLLALAPRARDPGDVLPFAREAARVSAVALVAVAVVTLSGVAQTLLFLPSPRDLVRSAYGVLTLAKAAGLLALVGFGAHHRARVLPRVTRDGVAGRFAGTLRGEVAVMLLVILLGGLLAYVPPAASPPTGAGLPNAPLDPPAP